MNKKIIQCGGSLLIVGLLGFGIGQRNIEIAPVQALVQEKEDRSKAVLNVDGVHFATPESEANSVIWTNIGPGSYQQADEVIAMPIDMPIYDLAFSKYSTSYALKYGYPQSHVIEMPQYVHLFEYRMKTVGRRNECRLNMLLEKDLGLNFPDGPFVNQVALNSQDGVAIVRPKKLPDWKETKEISRHRIEWMQTGARSLSNVKYLLRNAVMSTVGSSSRERGSSLDVGINEYSPQLYTDLDYVSLHIGCGSLSKLFLSKPANYIWIKKESGRDYSQIMNYFPEDFMMFEIPKELRDQFSVFMKSVPFPIYKIGMRKINSENTQVEGEK
jgi:hypothetical protein